MKILKYAFHVTPAKRRVMAALAMVVTLSSTYVQAAHAEQVLPDAPAWTATDAVDTTQDRGIQVPADHTIVPDAVPVATTTTVVSAALVRTTPNVVNAPDSHAKPDQSSETAARTMTVPATAYTSDPKECDSTPFTTADGSHVYDGVIAANFLKFGTRIRLPDQFGDKVFVVHDRMNARYDYRIDIWMPTKAAAFAWGVRTVKIEVLP